MPNFAANLSMMYGEVNFSERFAAAARDGFKGVEFLFPYEWHAADVAEWREAAGVKQALFNAPPGDWESGERGLGALPGRETEFKDTIGKALEYAAALDCPRIHVMAGLRPEDVAEETLYETYRINLTYAANEAAKQDRNVIIEPINTRDVPGYFLNRQADAHRLVESVGLPNLRVQMDLYHVQIVEGDVAMKVREFIGKVDHFQIAGVPERHEPDIGEMNYPYLFDLIDELGFEGWVGCEYRPQGETSAGLGWAAGYLS
ncbi:MAG: 2-oxo-tetronate isomerase [Pseudomonadota bacterium]|nr:2-oxo-tetronate isomerase [Pseudomonadota bacterium]